jgi:hypothetical protein
MKVAVHGNGETRKSKSDLNQFGAAELLFQQDPPQLIEKFEAFQKYASRQSIANF